MVIAVVLVIAAAAALEIYFPPPPRNPHPETREQVFLLMLANHINSASKDLR